MPGRKKTQRRKKTGRAKASTQRARAATTESAAVDTSARVQFRSADDALANLLVFHRIIGLPNELTARNRVDVLADFQSRAGLLADGLMGPVTRWALQSPWVQQAQKLLWVRTQADVVPGVEGFDHFVLREDAAERYQALRSEVVNLGGAITSAGGKRALSEGAGTGRSGKSMHYTGLAFDLALTSGFFKPHSDPFVVTKGEDGYWEVWARAVGGDETTLRAIYWDGWNRGVDRQKNVRGSFINFTKLCRKHGFHPIRPRLSFRRAQNRKYLSAEWWHFQANDLLVPDWSQFGIELLRIEGYTAASIQNQNEGVWGHRNSTFRVDWA